MKKEFFFVPFFLLSVLIIFHLIANYIWLANDDLPTGSDTIWHLVRAFDYHLSSKYVIEHPRSSEYILHMIYLIKSLNIFDFSYRIMKSLSFILPLGRFQMWIPFWPPLIYLVSAIFNFSYFSIFATRLWVNYVFFMILILSTFYLAKQWFGTPTGLLSAFIISLSPSVYGYSRQFGLDFPLLCIFTLCLCLLIYSNNFSNRCYSYFFGISLGVALLIKLQITIFLLFPLGYSFCKVVKREQRVKELMNFFGALGIACLLSSLYWAKNLSFLIDNVYRNIVALYPFFQGVKPFVVSQELVPFSSLRCYTFYLESMIIHVSWPLFILFSVSLFYLFVRKSKHWYLLFSIIIPYILLTLISSKWTRYAMPLITYQTIIISYGITFLFNKLMKKIVFIGVFIYCCVLYFLTSWSYAYISIPFFYPPMFPKDYATSRPPLTTLLTQRINLRKVVEEIEKLLNKKHFVTFAFTDGSQEVVLHYFISLYGHFCHNFIDDQIRIGPIDKDTYDAIYVICERREFLAGRDTIFAEYEEFANVLRKNENQFIILRNKEVTL